MKYTLVILPGWGGSAETWKEFIALAEKDFRVVCIDLPCFGTEPCPNTVWGVEEYADFVLEKIKKIDDQHIIFLGHSFGGQVAAYLTATQPRICQSLILLGAAALRPKRRLRRAFFGVMVKCGTLFSYIPWLKKVSILAKKVLYKAISSPDYLETDGRKREIFKKVIRQDLQAYLSKISVPTLLIWGTHDSYVSLALGKKMQTLIPGSRLNIIRDGQHGLHHTHAETVLGYIRSFITIT
jgi:pimeloyl-ACP methyl ester carboxylesterase